MPDKPNDETPPARASLARPATKLRKCRTCKTETPAALVHGECADCAGLIALPLRGAGGRFMTFTQPGTATTSPSSGTSGSGSADLCTRDGVTVRKVGEN